jgi:hypothetical protein
VPAFLRKMCPVFIQNDGDMIDFLSGRSGKGSRSIKIILKKQYTQNT